MIVYCPYHSECKRSEDDCSVPEATIEMIAAGGIEMFDSYPFCLLSEEDDDE